MVKQLLFADDAPAKLKKGIDIVATSAATTLGPKGHNVALDRSGVRQPSPMTV